MMRPRSTRRPGAAANPASAIAVRTSQRLTVLFLGGGHAVGQFALKRVHPPPRRFQQGAAVIGQVKVLNPPVDRVRPARNRAALFQVGDDDADGLGCDECQARDACPRQIGIGGKHGQDRVLRRRDAPGSASTLSARLR